MRVIHFIISPAQGIDTLLLYHVLNVTLKLSLMFINAFLMIDWIYYFEQHPLCILCHCALAEQVLSQLCVCIQGDLALLATEGQWGLPIGHIVSHNTDHALHIKFAKAIQAACSEADYIDLKLPEKEQ